MKLTDALLGEHGAFYAQFDRLEETVPHAATAAEVREQAALLAAALVTHAKLEDALLFKRLDAKIGAGAGPLAVMRADHEEIEGNLSVAEKAATAAAFTGGAAQCGSRSTGAFRAGGDGLVPARGAGTRSGDAGGDRHRVGEAAGRCGHRDMRGGSGTT